ncbi:MAG: hypothetical protein M3R04_05650 [bacterium]|nr:hypothetical protein [bacterium]
MGEITGARGRRGSRPNTILRLLLLGVLALLLAPAYAAYGVLASGRLALAQQAPASEILRGFDFGPVWLEQGEVGRYFINATLPQSDTATWHTSFEVLNSSRQPVFHQDEVRFIGEYQFHPGQSERTHHQFTLQKGTGYYYFRFKAHNGVYDAAPGSAPVVHFAIRQRVVNGWGLWGPVVGLLLTGLLLIASAVITISRLGQPSSRADSSEPGTSAPGRPSVVHG